MPKRSSTGRLDLNQLAKRIVDQATGQEAKTEPPPIKNEAAVALGRLGGKKGGAARAERLTPVERTRIAKIAAAARWGRSSKGKAMHAWSKVLTKSDAQEETSGAKMPFLRFTKEKNSFDHTTWFRDVFFKKAPWEHSDSERLNKEEAKIPVYVVILGNEKGERWMKLDHVPSRAKNNGAPTTHLHYDDDTKRELEMLELSGHTVEMTEAEGRYRLEIKSDLGNTFLA